MLEQHQTPCPTMEQLAVNTTVIVPTVKINDYCQLIDALLIIADKVESYDAEIWRVKVEIVQAKDQGVYIQMSLVER